MKPYKRMISEYAPLEVNIGDCKGGAEEGEDEEEAKEREELKAQI